MTDKLKLVRGDTRPQVRAIVRDETAKTPMDLTGATVRMLFRPAGGESLQATLAGVLLPGLEDEETGQVNSSPPYDVAGSGGRVAFSWSAGDLDCKPGEYEGEIKVTFPDTTLQTVYEILKFKVRDRFGA